MKLDAHTTWKQILELRELAGCAASLRALLERLHISSTSVAADNWSRVKRLASEAVRQELLAAEKRELARRSAHAQLTRRRNPGKPPAGRTALRVARYALEHWGKIGDTVPKRLRCANPHAKGEQPLTIIGELVKFELDRGGHLRAITYRTDKFGDGMSDYRHAFEKPFPFLAHTTDGQLVIAGGAYKMSARGIVG